MIEFTEQQEQEMIEKAKAGDPEANYSMSLWALEQAMAEPDEERWNRLAAKCLVKAAEAGYAPAKAKMDELLAQTGGAKASDAPRTEPAPAAQTVRPERPARTERPAEDAEAAAPASSDGGGDTLEKLSRLGKSAVAAFAALGGKLKGLLSPSDSASAAADDDAKTGGHSAKSGGKPALFDFSHWDEAKWKKMQIVCIVICVILAILITVMLITRRNRRAAAEEAQTPVIPVAEVVTTPIPAATPEPADYPSEEELAEIAAASLDVLPDDGDYVTEEKTVTVSTSGSDLYLRRGPGSTYNQVGSMPNRTTVNVYAYKNGWALVKYNGTWGWCSNEFLK